MRKAPNISTFIGCDAPYADARLVLFGAPFDGTTSYRPGTRFGPSAIRGESFGIETYSPYFERDLSDYAVCDVGELELPFGSPIRALEEIQACTQTILADEKIPFMLGGEHLITLGALRAVLERYPELCVLHFDAHTDLRDEYLGEKLSHASVMRRCWEQLGDGRIFSFGIRSGDRPEWLWAKEHISLCPFDFGGLPEALARIGRRPVYLSFDLDVLDPSELPGTGTPEAGGVRFAQVIEMLKQVAHADCNVVAADLNELCPILDPSGRSTALAVKLAREFMLLLLGQTR